MPQPVVRTERRARVDVVTIDRPEVRNAISPEVAEGIEAALDAAEADDGVDAVVLTGAGPLAFSSGADLKALAAGQAAGIYTRRGGFAGLISRDFPKLLVAAVNGPALAGGCEIVLACDLVVAAEHATFGLPEVARGLAASAGGPLRLAQRIPLAVAMELSLTGEPVDARRALELGLVNRVVAPDLVLDEALALCARIGAHAPLAVRGTKRIVQAGARLPDVEAWAVTREVSRQVNTSADALEGARAFAEKRPPTWSGR